MVVPASLPLMFLLFSQHAKLQKAIFILMCTCANVLIQPLAANTFLIVNKPFQIKSNNMLLTLGHGASDSDPRSSLPR